MPKNGNEKLRQDNVRAYKVFKTVFDEHIAGVKKDGTVLFHPGVEVSFDTVVDLLDQRGISDSRATVISSIALMQSVTEFINVEDLPLPDLGEFHD